MKGKLDQQPKEREGERARQTNTPFSQQTEKKSK